MPAPVRPLGALLGGADPRPRWAGARGGETTSVTTRASRGIVLYFAKGRKERSVPPRRRQANGRGGLARSRGSGAATALRRRAAMFEGALMPTHWLVLL